jgi:hypothetical protein
VGLENSEFERASGNPAKKFAGNKGTKSAYAD